MRDGVVVSFEELSAGDSVAGAFFFALVCDVTVLVLLIIWLWRAYSNTRVFGVGPWRWTRGWTIGGWFIPIANLVIPKLLINDAWRGAAPGAAGDGRWRKRPVAAVVTMWWVTFVAGYLLLRGTQSAYGVDNATPDVLVQIDRFAGSSHCSAWAARSLAPSPSASSRPASTSRPWSSDCSERAAAAAHASVPVSDLYLQRAIR